MPDGADDVYGSVQINIPPTFPFILKQYAKAAIRTQPYDLLKWSASYFRALAKGETPPIKDRLEYPPPDTPSGLSPGYLKVLIKQVGKSGTVTVDQLLERWSGICLAEEPLHEMLAVGQFGETIDWLHFVAVAAGFLCNNLTQTMVLLCNLLTEEPEGGSALISFHIFTKLYVFLAGLNCGNPFGEDEDDKREYILPDGSIFDVAYPFPVLQKQANCTQRDLSVSPSFILSSSNDQVFEAYERSKLSPEATPVSSPRNTPPSPLSDNASSSTLTPETIALFETYLEGNGKALVDPSEVKGIEAVQDRKARTGALSNQEMPFCEGKVQECTEETYEEASLLQDKENHDSKVHEVMITTSQDSKWSSNPPDPNNTFTESFFHESCPPKDQNGHGDVHNTTGIVPQMEEPTLKSRVKVQHVPGIGPVVDPIQVQAVLDYLKGVSLKQEGMIKPGNLRHFLCPPLEKVPASQKTKV